MEFLMHQDILNAKDSEKAEQDAKVLDACQKKPLYNSFLEG